VGLYTCIKTHEGGEEVAEKAVEELANNEKNKKFAAPYIALQGFYVNDEKTRDKALAFAKKAVER